MAKELSEDSKFNMKDEMARQKIDNIIKELDELKEELKELKKN